MNAREVLACVADWLGWQDEDLSFGLKSAEDGLRLYMYAQTHPDLAEMADEWERKDRIDAMASAGKVALLAAALAKADARVDALVDAMKSAARTLEGAPYFAYTVAKNLRRAAE